MYGLQNASAESLFILTCLAHEQVVYLVLSYKGQRSSNMLPPGMNFALVVIAYHNYSQGT